MATHFQHSKKVHHGSETPERGIRDGVPRRCRTRKLRDNPRYSKTIKSFKKGTILTYPLTRPTRMAMLDNTARAVSELKEVGGEAALETLLTLAPPRKEAAKYGQ